MAEEMAVAEGGAALSPGARIVDTFIAPSKTFEDVRRRSSGWWVPWLLTSLVALAFSYVVLNKIGMTALVDGIVHQSTTLEEKINSATPEGAAQIRSSITTQFKLMYASPVFLLLVGLMVAGIFLGTANFVFGGKAKYGQMLGVWFYGTLPLMLISILSVVMVYAGMSGDQFNIKNTVGTNIGYYLQGGSAPHWLVTMLSSVDVIAIWCAVLLTLGVSIVAGIKRSSAAIVVFGWWAVYMLLQTAGAVIGG